MNSTTIETDSRSSFSEHQPEDANTSNRPFHHPVFILPKPTLFWPKIPQDIWLGVIPSPTASHPPIARNDQSLSICGDKDTKACPHLPEVRFLRAEITRVRAKYDDLNASSRDVVRKLHDEYLKMEHQSEELAASHEKREQELRNDYAQVQARYDQLQAIQNDQVNTGTKRKRRVLDDRRELIEETSEQADLVQKLIVCVSELVLHQKRARILFANSKENIAELQRQIAVSQASHQDQLRGLSEQNNELVREVQEQRAHHRRLEEQIKASNQACETQLSDTNTSVDARNILSEKLHAMTEARDDIQTQFQLAIKVNDKISHQLQSTCKSKDLISQQLQTAAEARDHISNQLQDTIQDKNTLARKLDELTAAHAVLLQDYESQKEDTRAQAEVIQRLVDGLNQVIARCETYALAFVDAMTPYVGGIGVSSSNSANADGPVDGLEIRVLNHHVQTFRAVAQIIAEMRNADVDGNGGLLDHDGESEVVTDGNEDHLAD